MPQTVTPVEVATQYLVDGGITQTIDFATDVLLAGHDKIQIDADLALALCLLADEAIKLRLVRSYATQ